MTELRVGPAGWSYEDWKGPVYPKPAPTGFDALEYVARYFDTIEINSTFYRPCVPQMSETWARRTPDGFLFTAKLWEKFTHDKEGFTAADARLYQDGLAPLLAAGKLGALLLQFPWFFRDAPESRDRIRAIVDEFGDWAPLVIEVRHKSWLEGLDFLRELKLAFCNIDQPHSSSSIQETDIVSGPAAYVRLHGRNAKAWFSKEADRDQKYDYLYSIDELKPWLERVKGMAGDIAYVIFNNHFRGQALVNALQFKRLLGQPIDIPPELLSAFPGAL